MERQENKENLRSDRMSKSCKDCLHNGVCYMQETCNDIEQQLKNFMCENFTNRSEWAHLPCELGDIVFYFQGAYHLKNKSMWKIRPIKVTEFSMKMGKNGKLYPLSIIANGTRYPLTSIGKTLFLSRKEAEKALEEKK